MASLDIGPTSEARLRWLLVPVTGVLWVFALLLNMAARGVLFRHTTDPATEDPLRSFPSPNDSVALGDSVDNLFTFVQISDLHISRYNDFGGLPHAESFFERELTLIGPDLVLVTGDLIDAKSKSKLVSVQYMDEWYAYETLLNKTGVALRNNGSFYWELRGNHDCFNLGVEFNETEFGRISATKTEGFKFIHRKPFGSYDFVGIDLCPAVGTARPFNFFGTMDGYDMDVLASVIDEAKRSGHNHTFVATHYPTAVTVSGRSKDGRTLADLAKDVSLWMCGHLHQLVLGIGKTMYVYHRHPGMLELELGDMKDHAVYRVVAVDNDMISFTDELVHLPQIPMPAPPLGAVPTHWKRDAADSDFQAPRAAPIAGSAPPIILVTNPRDARFGTPGREPVSRIRASTHVRILIYTSTHLAPANISVTVDGAPLGANTAHLAKGVERHPPWPRKLPLDHGPDAPANHLPLWVVPWDPARFDDGREHVMEVQVIDDAGAEAVKVVVFRVDGERSGRKMGLTASGTLVLSIRFPLLFQSLFVFGHVVITFFLLLIPGLVVTHQRTHATLPGLRGAIMRRLRWLDASLERMNEGRIWGKLWRCCRRRSSSSDAAGSSSARGTGSGAPNSGGMSSDEEEDMMAGLGVGVSGGRPRRLTVFAYVFAVAGTLSERVILSWWYRLLALADNPSLYYPLYVFSMASVVGPWFLGDFVSSASPWWPNRYGLLFTVGIWFGLGKGWVPLADSWLYALWQITTLLFPMVLYLSILSCRRTGWLHTRMSGPPSLILRAFVLYFIYYHLKDGLTMGFPYGLVSAVTGAKVVWTFWATYVIIRRWVDPNHGDGSARPFLVQLAAAVAQWLPPWAVALLPTRASSGASGNRGYAPVGTGASAEASDASGTAQTVLIWQSEEDLPGGGGVGGDAGSMSPPVMSAGGSGRSTGGLGGSGDVRKRN
ncbi:Transmembrane protein 62 [Phlyctochytrium bullatum]|nr:Transmembrane protein 62 [Phlyctochytrium bullatum]